MKKIAFIFPGQGAQSVGMGKDIYDAFDTAKNVYETADKVLGYSISDICFNGPEEELKLTKNTQPAILTTSLACLEVLRKEINMEPSATAGHSLGEYGALYTAGVLSLEEAIKITGKRAELMNEAALETTGSMAAVLGLSEELLQEGLKELSKDGLISVANYNCPGQIVITGEKHVIEKSVDLLKNKGAKRVVELAVSGAFHSELMTSASKQFEKFISKIKFNDALVPVYENTDAKAVLDGNELKARAPKQICSSVHWTETIQGMMKEEITTFVEIGPGKVLAGLNKKISADIITYNVYDLESLQNTINELKGE